MRRACVPGATASDGPSAACRPLAGREAFFPCHGRWSGVSLKVGAPSAEISGYERATGTEGGDAVPESGLPHMTPAVDMASRASAHGRGLRTAGPAPVSNGAPDGGVQRTILVAEDDHSCRSALHAYFERNGYRVTEAVDGPSTLRAVFQHSANLVILDLGLPGFDGSDVLAKIRRHSSVPVIVCSGRDSEEERIRTLNLGADDYVVKPFSFAELEARVRAVLRRGNGEPAAKYFHHGDLMVDRDTRTVTVRDEVVPMTRKEFDLLAFLVASPGQVFSREDLLERVWGSTEEWQGRSTVTEHVRRVRLKIEPDPDKPRWITTVRGVGYRFSLPDA